MTKFLKEEPTSNDLPIQNTNKDKSREMLTWSHEHEYPRKYKDIEIAYLQQETQIAFLTQGYIRDNFKISCITSLLSASST